ncbi:MAG TPA: MFS transporter [Phycisphaerae bacterium]|nr:MFS transporter [Phycisphaerae bacterium]
MIFLSAAVAAVGFAIMLQMGLNANFLAGEMGISGFQMGMLEALRESCGILAFAILAILAGLAEPLIAALMLAIFAVGLGCYAAVPNYSWLLAVSVVWSQGLHVWMPLPNSMMLSLAEPGRTGRRLGQMRSAGAVGSALGLGVALVLTLSGITIRPMYVLAGAAALLAAAACLGVPRNIKTPGPRFVFRRRHGLFYLLSFLEGWRKQIFIAFAGFLLVKVYHTPLWTMLCLWMVVQGIGWFASPRVGKLIDRVGERRILMFYFAALTVFFCGYALVPNRYVLYGLFVVDNAFFVFAMALTTYVRRIAPASEHTPTLSMGVAMNHVAAVTMPLVGGFLWKYLGYQWAFFAGAAAAALSILAAMRVPPHPPQASDGHVDGAR